jgi:hypothetical protein
MNMLGMHIWSTTTERKKCAISTTHQEKIEPFWGGSILNTSFKSKNNINMLHHFIFALLIIFASTYPHAYTRIASGKISVCDAEPTPEKDTLKNSFPMKGFCIKRNSDQAWIIEPVFYEAFVDKETNYLIGIKKSQGIYINESYVHSEDGKLIFKVEGQIQPYHNKWAGITKVKKPEIFGLNPPTPEELKSNSLLRILSIAYTVDVAAESWFSALGQVFYADNPFYYSVFRKNLNKGEIEWIGPDGTTLLKPNLFTRYGAPLFFNNGLVAASTKDDKWGAINRKGEWVIQPKYENFRMDFFGSGGTDRPTIIRDQFIGYTRVCGLFSCDVTSDYYDPNYKYKYTKTEEVSKIWIVEAIKRGRVFNDETNGIQLSVVGIIMLFLTIWPFATIRRWFKTNGAIKIFFLSITDSAMYTAITIAVGALFLLFIVTFFGLLLLNSMALSDIISDK